MFGKRDTEREAIAFLKKNDMELFRLSVGKETAKEIDAMDHGTTFTCKLTKVSSSSGTFDVTITSTRLTLEE